MTQYTIGFPRRSEWEKAEARLVRLRLPHQVLHCDPGYSRVGVPALVCGPEGLSTLQDRALGTITLAGWVAYRPSAIAVPAAMPPQFDEDIFGEAAIMFLGQCMADEGSIRLIAHLSGDIGAALPYLNAEIAKAYFKSSAGFLTVMHESRIITLYSRRIAIGKAHDLVDAWRTLEWVRTLVNGIWQRRSQIVPSHEARGKPSVWEIHKRLPRSNCGACGESTCLAFAARLWRGDGNPRQCAPAFDPSFTDRKAAFLDLCSGLGLPLE